ncbi:hypothetical protein M426DRAFT_320958 [Hypoxylon sp. CI-4A]|nr:hypothetical protein M426DRAFT_320958 [Hypoxylon sp. CI-4A]
MLSLLPDLAPRDSHSLWYTSTRNPFSSTNASEAYTQQQHQHQQHQQHQHQQHELSGIPHGANNHRRGAHLIERSPLARLRADEQNLERRRQNVSNFGAAWLKPPGIPKTLHQLREERREVEEHQEAMRREQLAQELAEAEAAGTRGVDDILDEALGDDGVMDDVQLDGARDLDEDIPEADADFGIGSDDDDDEDEDEDSSEEEDDEDEEEEEQDPEQRAAQAQQQLMAQRMRQADDAFRESMARGRDDTHYYGVDEEVDDEDQAQMIEEDDLVGHGDDGDMGMDGDLDDDIPEAEDESYEHTDSDEGMSSEEDDHVEMSFAAQTSQSGYRLSLAQSTATRHSLTMSDILSHDGNSLLESSPEIQRRRNSGPMRRGRG